METKDSFDMNIRENQNHAKAYCSGLLISFSKNAGFSKIETTYMNYVINDLMQNAGMLKPGTEYK